MELSITPQHIVDSFANVDEEFAAYDVEERIDMLRDEVIQHYDFENRAREAAEEHSDDIEDAEERALALFQNWFDTHVESEEFENSVIQGATHRLRMLMKSDVQSYYSNEL